MTTRPLTLENAPGEVRRYIQLGYKFPKADQHGHRTRFSDSSMYDERCLLCGETDQTSGPLNQSCGCKMTDEELAALRDPPKVDQDWDPQP